MYNPLTNVLQSSPGRRYSRQRASLQTPVPISADALPHLPWQAAAKFHSDRDPYEREILARLQADLGEALSARSQDQEQRQECLQQHQHQYNYQQQHSPLNHYQRTSRRNSKGPTQVGNANSRDLPEIAVGHTASRDLPDIVALPVPPSSPSVGPTSSRGRPSPKSRKLQWSGSNGQDTKLDVRHRGSVDSIGAATTESDLPVPAEILAASSPACADGDSPRSVPNSPTAAWGQGPLSLQTPMQMQRQASPASVSEDFATSEVHPGLPHSHGHNCHVHFRNQPAGSGFTAARTASGVSVPTSACSSNPHQLYSTHSQPSRSQFSSYDVYSHQLAGVAQPSESSTAAVGKKGGATGPPGPPLAGAAVPALAGLGGKLQSHPQDPKAQVQQLTQLNLARLAETDNGQSANQDYGRCSSCCTALLAQAVKFCHECGANQRSAEEKSIMLQATQQEQLQKEAWKQLLDPHLVMVGAEKAITEAALAAARGEARREQVMAQKRTRRSLIEQESAKDAAHKAALLSFIPRVMERAVSHGLVTGEQWKVLLESPVKSWYEPVLSRFPAAVVFADASGFTKLTETLAKLPNGAEQIGKTLNNFFGPLIDIVAKHGGDIIKFSGDALTIVWPAADPAPRRFARPGSPSYVPPRCGGENSRGRASFRTEMDIELQAPRESKVAAVEAAARCCLEIQAQIPRFGKTPVPSCSLTMHIGVGFAEVALLQVGGLLGRWEFCLAGKALDQISIAEPLAASGETVFSPEAIELAGEHFEFELLEACDAGENAGGGGGGAGVGHESPGSPNIPISPSSSGSPNHTPYSSSSCSGGFGKLLGPSRGNVRNSLSTAAASTAPIPKTLAWWPAEGAEPLMNVSAKLIKRFIPTSVGICLASAVDMNSVDYPEEMRRVSVVFLSIRGLDPADEGQEESGPGAGDARVSGGMMSQLLMRLFQRSVYALEGSVNKFLVDDKGVLLLIVFGLPPLIHLSDDPIRATLCAMRLTDTLADEQLEGRVGVATGMCWCGVVGNKSRREYTVLGDVVNLSARLMGKAPVNGVLVDAPTRDAARRVLAFEDGGDLTLKGKAAPVHAFKFVGMRRGIHTNFWEAKTSLLASWKEWPARPGLASALECLRGRSGVMVITGPGGSGKTELAAQAKAWAKGQNYQLLRGQNMDPTSIFSVPRLPLQEAFSDLVRLAGRDPYWRSVAQELLRVSVGQTGPTDPAASEGAGGSEAGCDAEEIRGSAGAKALIRDLPRHAELYWMLIAMLQRAVGERASPKIQTWAPLLAMVVTDLAFSQGLVAAMEERDEQHIKHSRFAEACTAVIDGYTRCLPPGVGCMILLHIRRSSAFFQSRDEQESAAIRQIAELCMERRRAGNERNPLVLCVVARKSVLKDGKVLMYSEECQTKVETEDLSLEDTEAFMRHLLLPSPSEPELFDEHRVDLSRYAFDVAGGNPKGVLAVLQDLDERGVVTRTPTGFEVSNFYLGYEGLRATVPLPASLVGMAFSTFEMLPPEDQRLLKMASTLNNETFGVRDLMAMLPKASKDDVTKLCERLADPSARTFRKVSLTDDGGSNTRGYMFYSMVLRHVASTLVLETQRTEIRRMTAMGVNLNAGDMARLERIAGAAANMDEDEESESGSDMSDSEQSEGEEEEEEDDKGGEQGSDSKGGSSGMAGGPGSNPKDCVPAITLPVVVQAPTENER